MSLLYGETNEKIWWESEGSLQHRSKWGLVVKVGCIGVRSYSKKAKEEDTKTDLFTVDCGS